MIVDGSKETRIVRENMDVSAIPGCIEELECQIRQFQADPEGYVYTLLLKKESHVLFSLFNEECLDRKIPQEFRDRIADRYAWLGKKLYRTENLLNRRNNFLSAEKLWEYFRRSPNALNLRERTQFSQYLRNFWHIRHDNGLLNCIGRHYDCLKDWLSTRRMLDYFFDWQGSDRDPSKPYFAYIHTLDIHGQSAVFDICSTDEEEIALQMEQIDHFVDDLSPHYRGNLGYDLGLVNLDHTVEWLCRELEKRDILKDTVLVITSDHGCGTTYEPLRGMIQNFHDECYHVPFILYGAGIEPYVDQNFHITKDIMATIAELTGTRAPASTTGISVFSGQKREWVNQEYMGPGCPDMYRKPIWMCAFDESWKVFIKVRLMQEQFEYSLEEIYDRQRDRKELKNLAHSKVARESCTYLLDHLHHRWQEIKGEYSRSGNYGK